MIIPSFREGLNSLLHVEEDMEVIGQSGEWRGSDYAGRPTPPGCCGHGYRHAGLRRNRSDRTNSGG